VDLSTLRQLADDGLSSVSADLPDLVAWCRNWCLETGDARYCFLAEMLHVIDNWWGEHDERGGIPEALLEQLDSLMKASLPLVLDADSPSAGAQRAEALRHEAAELLTSPDDW